ncbi:MAG: family 78 glycoside hydrolase catalytic domain [Clostridia bacterium]|nr:family 78 glycoside hydrolase catalytic domain [Clostridia bacterium]
MTGTELFKGARFIDCPGSLAPVFKKTFTAVKGEAASIVICGLGFFRLYINGRKVSGDLLVPNASNYSERDLSRFEYPLVDKLSFRTYCMKYDISDYLEDGENVMTVLLGTGYYCQVFRDAEGYVTFGKPKLCYAITKGSGDVLSDSSTLVNSGFVTQVSLYYGEKQDYNLLPADWMTNPDSGNFTPSREIPAPDSNYMIQTSPADKVIESITGIVLLEDNEDGKLYDAGINTVGYAVLKCRKPHEKITVSYAEDIYDKPGFGIHFKEGYQTEEFITDGEDREYIPLFTWHGFRYFRVKGDAEVVRVDVVHSDVPVTSSFESDSRELNWLYSTYVHTQLCNMHSGVPSDCPHRERLGYTGDGQLCCEAAMLTLGCREFYRKWLYDIADSQCTETGHVAHTAPVMGGGGGPCGWGGAIVEVPYRFYKIYGDRDLLNEFFPKMLRYFEYIESRTQFGLVCREEKDGWCLGDWLPPEEIKIPESFVNTCLYIGFMKTVIEIGEILGRQSETARLPALIERSSQAVDAAYYSSQQHAYIGGIQGASALALSAGLGDEKVFAKMAGKYKALGMYDTGIIATPALTQYLFEHGEGQTAFNLLAGRGEVSFDFMARNGATTLWENWNGQSSKNHPMFGAVTKCLFTYLLGIRQDENSAGFESVTISPVTVEGLNRVKGHITTVRGVISVEIIKDKNSVTIKAGADPSIKAKIVYGGKTAGFTGSGELSVNTHGE